MARGTDSRMDKKLVGERLRVAREAMRMAQDDFANKAGIAKSTYNQYELGKRLIPPGTAVALCEAHGLTLEWIYMADANNLPYKTANAIKALMDI